MWEKPWTIKEGMTIGAGLVATGVLLQLSIGPIDWTLFAFPVNIIILVVLLLAVYVAYALRKKAYVMAYMMTGKAAIAALAYASVLTVVMGLLPQSAGEADDAIGLTHMLSSWSFVLVYLWTAFIVGMVGLHQTLLLARGKKTSLSALLSHLGLFIALVCSTLGSSDMQRLKMTVKTGKPEWRAQDDKGRITELPLAIELHDFAIEEYPMKAVVIDNTTGKPVGDDNEWQLTMTRQMEHAAPNIIDSVTVEYVEWPSVGAASAAYVKAINRRSNERREGWISCGSFAFAYHGLKLDSLHSAVMPEREPKRFSSAVSIYTKSGKKFNDTILVNKPLDIEGWKIYQLSYDETLGRWSDVSILELVSDPWLPAVYAGIGMMLAGAVLMFMKKKKGNIL